MNWGIYILMLMMAWVAVSVDQKELTPMRLDQINDCEQATYVQRDGMVFSQGYQKMKMYPTTNFRKLQQRCIDEVLGK